MSPIEASAKANLPQQVGRYDVLGRLDMGGMAEILLGQLRGPSGFEHPVVIKRILPHLSMDKSFREMFLDEASIAAGVRHANVVHVHELGEEGEDLFLVMEYLEGEPVTGVQRRAAARGRLLDPKLCAYIVAQAAAGLHAAHELKDQSGQPRNIVHRDVSPQNVFVTYEGMVKVLDFGIAKAADRITKTEAGLVKGKFNYMSPEQCRGEPLDRRSDVFALGIVLYEMITGRRLFKRASQAATVRAVLEHEIIPPSELVPDVPPAVEHACLRALSRSRRKRYQTAAELRRDLLRAVAPGPDEDMLEERLRGQMQHLFEDRIAQKGEMLRRAEHGEDLGLLPPTVADAEVELPGVDSQGGDVDTSRVTLRPETARRNANTFLLALAMLLLGAGVGFVGWRFAIVGDGPPTETRTPLDATPSPAPAPPEVVEPTAGADQTTPSEGSPAPAEPAAGLALVTIHIDSSPSGARVQIGGETRGETPLDLVLPRGDEPVSLVVSMDGRVSVEEVLTPDVDQRLRLSLVRKRRPIRRPTPGMGTMMTGTGFMRWD